MAATRRVTHMVERNRDLTWVKDTQVKQMREDTREARRLAYYEYNRLDEIMSRGMIRGGNEIDVERYRAEYERLHGDERDPEAPVENPTPPKNYPRVWPTIVCLASVTLAVMATKILS